MLPLFTTYWKGIKIDEKRRRGGEEGRRNKPESYACTVNLGIAIKGSHFAVSAAVDVNLR